MGKGTAGCAEAQKWERTQGSLLAKGIVHGGKVSGT